MKQSNKDWVIPRDERVPFWLRKSTHAKLKKTSIKLGKPMLIIADEIIERFFDKVPLEAREKFYQAYVKKFYKK